MRVAAKLSEMGLALPEPMRAPPGFIVKWRQIRVVGARAVIAGHGPRNVDGSFSGPSGKVGADLTLEEGYEAARKTALAILGDLEREIGGSRPCRLVDPCLRDGELVSGIRGTGSGDRRVHRPDDRPLRGEAAVCPRAVAGVPELALGSPVIIEGEVELSDA